MIEQVAIAILGPLAAWLSQDRRPRFARWACVAGLAGQPFWLYATFAAQQWGMLLVSAIYTVAWARGVRTFWLRPPEHGAR